MLSLIRGIKSAIWNCCRSKLTTAVVSLETFFFPPNVYIDKRTSFMLRLQKKCSALSEAVQKCCVISDQHKTCWEDKTLSQSPKREERNFWPWCWLQEQRNFGYQAASRNRRYLDSPPNIVSDLLKLYTYGAYIMWRGKKKTKTLRWEFSYLLRDNKYHDWLNK